MNRKRPPPNRNDRSESIEETIMKFAASKYVEVEFPAYPTQSDVSPDVLKHGQYIWDVFMAYKFKAIQDSAVTNVPKPEPRVFCFFADFTRPMPDPLAYNLEYPFVINMPKILDWMYSDGDLFRNISSFINCYLMNVESTEDESQIKNYTYAPSRKVNRKLLNVPENLFLHLKACVITLFTLDSEELRSKSIENAHRNSMLYREFAADNNWCGNTEEMDSLFNDMKAKVNDYLNRGIKLDVSRVLKQIRRKLNSREDNIDEEEAVDEDID